jgi:transposase, IS5 family
VLDAANTASEVRADTAYRSRVNLALLEKRGPVAQFQRAKPRGKPMPSHVARAMRREPRVRSRVEHVFTVEKRRMGLVVRTIGLARATAKITLANLAYNLRRLAWIEGSVAPA